ncbi:MAG: M12 family metallo-peptidase [Pyrinomonadaceae bacterium]
MNRRKYPRTALSALALCLFAAAAMLVSPAASGQKENPAAEEIRQVLTSFESLTLDPAAVLRSAREGGSVTLQTARGAFDLEVEPFDVRSDNYRAVAAGAGGVMTELARTPSNSWRGRVRGQEGTFVRLYLDGEKVSGIIITPAETFYVEPARDLSAAAGSKDFVFYELASVKPTDAVCEERTLAGKVTAQAAGAGLSAKASGATRPPADEIFGPRAQVDIATEADFEYAQFNGGNTTTTNNDILSIMTQVDGIYEANLGVDVRVVFQRVWLTNNDPYEALDAGELLDELTDAYDDTFGTNGTPPSRDLVHLFTGKELDGNTIGIAWTGALCDSPAFSYGLSQSKSFGLVTAQRVALTAHEVGHNFGAHHTGPGGPNDPPQQIAGCESTNLSGAIMQPAVTAATGFCQFSRDEITGHLTGSGGECLARLTTPGCNYAITPTAQAFPVAGGTGTVNVTANCAWGVAEGAPWVTFSTEAGTGNGSTGYTVAANNGKDGPRRAFVDIGGRQFAITQPGSPACLAGASQISIGQTISASLASTDCTAGQPNRLTAFEDVYTFVARAGQRVRVEMSGAPSVDAYLYLFNPDGSLLAENDDIVLGVNTDSRIPDSTNPTPNDYILLPQTGIYTIAATTFSNNDTGTYTLRLLDKAFASSVSLSSAAYSVNEGTGGGGLGVDGSGFRVVTVTRAGDPAGTATVDYATSDGSASKQKDYTQALGTLVFAPNETSKTFTVFVEDDAFAEGAETVTLTLSNAVGTTLGGTSTAALTINSNDGVSGPSPVRAQSFNPAFFVRQQYLDFLSREPDTSGFNFWQGDINQCGADEPCKEVKRINVSAAFFQSIEFRDTGYLVYRTYKAAYGDTTSPNVAGTVPVIRLNEFLPDAQRIGQNVVVGEGPWEQTLLANKNAYALEFVLRQRFLTAFPLTMTAEEFVNKLVQNAGITLTADERNALIAQLTSNANVAAARAAVLRAVAENQQLQDNEFRRAFVLMQYYGYLRRNPDDPQDTDFRGWRFWLDKLNEFNGNFVQAEMVKAFITSDEYIDRFGTRP